MLTDFTGADRVYIACGYTDLRRGIDGLAAMVQQEFSLDPFTNTLFLFCGRRRDRIKALYWEGNGFVLLYKRLESGSFQWPRTEREARALTPQQFPARNTRNFRLREGRSLSLKAVWTCSWKHCAWPGTSSLVHLLRSPRTPSKSAYRRSRRSGRGFGDHPKVCVNLLHGVE